MTKRRKRRNEKKRTIDSAMRRLKNNTRRQAHQMGDKVKFIETELKMSEVLIDFMSPYLDEVETLHQYKSLVGIAAFAWNAAMMSSEMHAEVLQKITQTVSRSARAGIETLFMELLERKQRHFSHIERFIINYQVTDLGDDWHLSVAFALTPDEIQEYDDIG